MTKHARWLGAALCAAVSGLAPVGAQANDLGMTWGKVYHDAGNGVDKMSCDVVGFHCDAYNGDTQCTSKLPVLCVKVDGSPRPNYDVPDSSGGGIMPPAFYNGWARGHLAATVPVLGSKLTSPQAANALCAAKFGEGWHMAEHHDGRYITGMDRGVYYGDEANWQSPSPWSDKASRSGGWSLVGYGNLPEDTRYWVRIIGQRANCWD
jgi:hypothetical protein